MLPVALLLPLTLLFVVSWVGNPLYSPGRLDTIALPAFILLIAGAVHLIAGGKNTADAAAPKSGKTRRVFAHLFIWVLPFAAFAALAVKPVRDEFDNVRGNRYRTWSRSISAFTKDNDIFFITGKWRTTFEYNFGRTGRTIHYVSYPSAREDHPNWLDWSEYETERFKADAEIAADIAAELVERHDTTVWVYPENPGKVDHGQVELLDALAERLQLVQLLNHPRTGALSYYAFRKRKPRYEDSARSLATTPWKKTRLIGERDIFKIAHTLQTSGNTDMAIRFYEQLLRDEPEHYQAHFNLAYAYMNTKRQAEAIPHFQRTLEIHPAYTEAYLHLSTCYLALGQTESAKQFKKLYEMSQ